MAGRLDNRFASQEIHSPKDRGGFTLFEVMIALAMAMIIFAGGFGALSQGTRLVEMSRDETRASQILQSEIEDLRTYDWTTLSALSSNSTYSPQSTFSSAYADRYTIERKIIPSSSTQKRVTVEVSWTDNRGTTHTREYYTLISKDGLYDFYYRSF